MNVKALLDRCKLTSFIAIDLETTGLNSKKEAIIEVSAVKFVDGEENSVFSHLLNPNKPISSFIEDLTGINDDMVKNKPSFIDILDDLMNFIGDLPIVGHNVKFDIDFIKEHSKNNYNLSKSHNICDTYLLSKIVLFSNEEHSLESVSEFYDLSIEGSHRATNDASNSGKILIRLISELLEFDSVALSRIHDLFNDREIPNRIIIDGLF